jgi:predicted enzyme related to lactoylglutathione lyase
MNAKHCHRMILWAARAAACLMIGGAYAQQAPKPDEAPPPVKALTMMATAVPVSDLERSLDFYTKGLGLVPTRRVKMGTTTEAPLNFPGGGPYIILLKSEVEGATLTPRAMSQRVILAVPDLKALEGQLKSAGYQLQGKINEMAQYHTAVAQLEDPDGNHIELVQRTP